jgi:hypothetical protein
MGREMHPAPSPRRSAARASVARLSLAAAVLAACEGGGTRAAPARARPAIAPAPSAAIAPPGAGAIVCGSLACDARDQACCLFHEASPPPRCVARVAELSGPTESPPEWPLVEACLASGGTERDLREVDRCDGSADCPTGQRCCLDHLGREHHQRRCSRDACAFFEVCSAVEPCRTRGTRCVGGECHAVASVACAGAPCAGPEQMCCTSEKLDDYACRPAAACDPFFPRIECTRPGDCPTDQDCEITQGIRSECRGGPHDNASTSVACEADRDCARYACPRGARCTDVPTGGGMPPGVARVCACR